MWTDENLNDAMHLLLNAAPVEQVTTADSSYILANQVTYTEELYALALEQLIREGQLQPVGRFEDRQKFKRPESKDN